jgi:hypothetical protein
MLPDRWAVSALARLGEGRRIALGLTIVTVIGYLATLTRTPTGDSLLFVLAIEHKHPADLLLPHRLLIQPLGWAFVQFWEALGWRGGALLPLQVFSALGGGAAAALIYAIGRRLTDSTGAALLAALGFVVSAGAWWFGADAEPVLPPLALALATVWGLLAAGPAPSPRRVVLLGLATALAILTYVSSALLVPVLAIGLGLAEGYTRTERWQRVGLFVGVVVAAVVPIYLLAMATAFGVRDVQAAQSWRLYGGLSEASAAYGQTRWANLPYGAYGFLRSILWYPALRPDESTAAYLATATWAERAAFTGYLGVSLGAAAAPFVALAVLAARRRPVVHRRMGGAMLVAWGVLNAAFAGWWVPSDWQFWAPALAAWWLLVGLVLAASRKGGGAAFVPGSSAIRRLSPWLAATAGVLLLLVVNGFGLIAPGLDAERDRRYVMTAGLRAVTAPGDLVVTNGLDGFPLYLEYFAPRELVDVYAATLNGRPAEETLAGVDRELSAAKAAGRRIFVVRGRTAGDYGAGADAAGQATLEAAKRQRMWPTWNAHEELRLAIAYLDRLPTRQVWGHDDAAIFEVVSASGTAGP